MSGEYVLAAIILPIIILMTIACIRGTRKQPVDWDAELAHLTKHDN
jgi:hypothetical protein